MYRKALGLVKAVSGSHWFHPLLLLVWIAVGAALRYSRLTSKAPWADEFSTIVFSLGHSFRTVPLDRAIAPDVLLQPLQPDPTTGIGGVIHYLLKESNHPPVYFVLTHLWMRLFPTEGGLVSLWAARSLPALFGIASIPAMFGLGCLAFRSRLAGQMAAAMMAVSPFGVFLAREARHYTLATLLVIASLCCFIVATRAIYQRTPLPMWLGLTWVGINSLGIATHYFFALTLCAEALALLLLAWRQHQTRVNKEKERNSSGELRNLKPLEETSKASREFSASGSIARSVSSFSYISHSLSSSVNSQLNLHCSAFSPKLYWRLYLVAGGTLIGGLVWLPVLHSNYSSELTHWIYDRKAFSSWIEPIGRVVAWAITMLVSLPMDIATLPLGIAIGSGLVTVIFLLWALSLLGRSFKPQQLPIDKRLNVQVLVAFVAGAIALFLGFTYGLGADLTLAPRYQFVYFPAAIALLGAALAACWDAPFSPTRVLSKPAGSQLLVLPRFRIDGKKAVMLIWLMGLIGGLTVVWNFGYLQSLRSDLLVKAMQNLSNSPVLIATTHEHHGHTGRMMALAWEFKSLDLVSSPADGRTASPQFLLAHSDWGQKPTRNPTTTLQETVAGLPRPLDVWLVNFHAKVKLEQQNCFAVPKSWPKVDSYWYRLYRCPAPK